MKQTIILLVLTVQLFTACQNKKSTNLALLNDQIPGGTALVFGKGIISTSDFEFAITFSPEMDELFFTRRKPDADNAIYTMRFAEGKWSEPEEVFFKANEGWDFEPHISPNGQKLYFGSTRPLPDAAQSTGLHQWYCTNNAGEWSQPLPLENPFVDRSIVMYLTSSAHNNLYFTTGEQGDKPEDWVIYQSMYEKDGYKSIDRMGKAINGKGNWIAHSFIAPDESYLIYDFKSDTGYGKSDLYISFNNNGNWTEPHNLGPEVNTDQTEMCASVSPDGKYLFFHRGEDDHGDIYWIDFLRIKEKLKKAIQ